MAARPSGKGGWGRGARAVTCSQLLAGGGQGLPVAPLVQQLPETPGRPGSLPLAREPLFGQVVENDAGPEARGSDGGGQRRRPRGGPLSISGRGGRQPVPAEAAAGAELSPQAAAAVAVATGHGHRLAQEAPAAQAAEQPAGAGVGALRRGRAPAQPVAEPVVEHQAVHQGTEALGPDRGPAAQRRRVRLQRSLQVAAQRQQLAPAEQQLPALRLRGRALQPVAAAAHFPEPAPAPRPGIRLLALSLGAPRYDRRRHGPQRVAPPPPAATVPEPPGRAAPHAAREQGGVARGHSGAARAREAPGAGPGGRGRGGTGLRGGARDSPALSPPNPRPATGSPRSLPPVQPLPKPLLAGDARSDDLPAGI